eukprot:TRINITY_DN2950_c1_g3_i3.p1 TRINITY_DN2950_c1_g3~~TRINITY_DN2950_c1_g3_i3.p1  ORF type:complete len:711 (+),score=93.15 TRINITY_DN2950_c1_g3_i3:113-2245(+)
MVYSVFCAADVYGSKWNLVVEFPSRPSSLKSFHGAIEATFQYECQKFCPNGRAPSEFILDFVSLLETCDVGGTRQVYSGNLVSEYVLENEIADGTQVYVHQRGVAETCGPLPPPRNSVTWPLVELFGFEGPEAQMIPALFFKFDTRSTAIVTRETMAEAFPGNAEDLVDFVFAEADPQGLGYITFGAWLEFAQYSAHAVYAVQNEWMWQRSRLKGAPQKPAYGSPRKRQMPGADAAPFRSPSVDRPTEDSSVVGSRSASAPGCVSDAGVSKPSGAESEAALRQNRRSSVGRLAEPRRSVAEQRLATDCVRRRAVSATEPRRSVMRPSAQISSSGRGGRPSAPPDPIRGAQRPSASTQPRRPAPTRRTTESRATNSSGRPSSRAGREVSASNRSSTAATNLTLSSCVSAKHSEAAVSGADAARAAAARRVSSMRRRSAPSTPVGAAPSGRRRSAPQSAGNCELRRRVGRSRQPLLASAVQADLRSTACIDVASLEKRLLAQEEAWRQHREATEAAKRRNSSSRSPRPRPGRSVSGGSAESRCSTVNAAAAADDDVAAAWLRAAAIASRAADQTQSAQARSEDADGLTDSTPPNGGCRSASGSGGGPPAPLECAPQPTPPPPCDTDDAKHFVGDCACPPPKYSRPESPLCVLDKAKQAYTGWMHEVVVSKTTECCTPDASLAWSPQRDRSDGLDSPQAAFRTVLQRSVAESP